MNLIKERVVVVDFNVPRQVTTMEFWQYDTNVIKLVVKNNGEAADLSKLTNIVVNFRSLDKKGDIKNVSC